MGILWRLFAPKPLKKARRALHPSWVIEDAVVRSVRNGRRRKARSRRPYFWGEIPDEDGRGVWKCPHHHSRLDLAEACARREVRRRLRLLAE